MLFTYFESWEFTKEEQKKTQISKFKSQISKFVNPKSTLRLRSVYNSAIINLKS